MTKKNVKWTVSLALCIVSLDGLLAFWGILGSVDTPAQYLVAISHIAYVMAGIAIVIGIWRSARSTTAFIIIWGLTSLGAALGGPLAFSSSAATNIRAVIGITVGVLLITSVLTWYVHKITHE